MSLIKPLLLLLALVNSVCVVLIQNPFFSLLFLILTFLVSALVFFFLECEFFALILLIIYIGAVAILMLFVLIMLETKLKKLFKNLWHHFPFGVFMIIFFSLQLSNVILSSFNFSWKLKKKWLTFNIWNTITSNNHFFFSFHNFDTLIDLESVGHVVYTHFVLQFIVVGLILFVSLVGVVFLTVMGEKKKRKTFTSASIMLSPTAQKSSTTVEGYNWIVKFFLANSRTFSQISSLYSIQIQEFSRIEWRYFKDLKPIPMGRKRAPLPPMAALAVLWSWIWPWIVGYLLIIAIYLILEKDSRENLGFYKEFLNRDFKSHREFKSFLQDRYLKVIFVYGCLGTAVVVAWMVKYVVYWL